MVQGINIIFGETLKSCVLYIHLTVQTQIVSRDITVLSLAKDLYFVYRNYLKEYQQQCDPVEVIISNIQSTQHEGLKRRTSVKY